MADREYKLWWCLWSVPDSIPREHKLESWPSTMKGWLTGSGDGYTTWVGAVWAHNEDEARATVHSCYGKSAKKIAWRGSPDEKPDNFKPSDRFPGSMPPKPEPDHA